MANFLFLRLLCFQKKNSPANCDKITISKLKLEMLENCAKNVIQFGKEMAPKMHLFLEIHC